MSTLANTAFPPYTIFHATLGYCIVLIGLAAIISRIFVMCTKASRNVISTVAFIESADEHGSCARTWCRWRRSGWSHGMSHGISLLFSSFPCILRSLLDSALSRFVRLSPMNALERYWNGRTRYLWSTLGWCSWAQESRFRFALLIECTQVTRQFSLSILDIELFGSTVILCT